MRMADIILKKRNGQELSKEEIDFFIREYVKGSIPDYQASALLMAVYFQGMTKRETADLTMAMAYSGNTVDLSGIKGIKADKHSTGGVGDTTTLIVAPLVAACGIPMAKMSGRGLGHTGGTLDKLEAIPGFKVSLTKEDFISIVNKIGAAIVGQTEDLVPADKKLYALRDVTATIDNISLIASSIMSKKIAAGAEAIVLDVKTGNGAFMKSIEDSFALAEEMVDIGTTIGRKTVAVVTDMSQPLGTAIGNALEVKEAIEVLKGMNKGPLLEVCLLLGSYILCAAKRCTSIEEASGMMKEALESGKGAAKLKQMIEAQGGDAGIVDHPGQLICVKRRITIYANKDGFIQKIDAQAFGIAAMLLGAGRSRKEDSIDLNVGVIMKKRVGDQVMEGEPLAELYVNEEGQLEDVIQKCTSAITIGKEKAEKIPLVFGVVTEKGTERW